MMKAVKGDGGGINKIWLPSLFEVISRMTVV